MRAGRVLLVIAALALQGCDPLVGGGCHDARIPAVVPIDLSGTWTGKVRDAVSMRFELRQAHAITEPRRQVRLNGTVSITIPGPVAASDSVTGWTLAIPNCDESRIRRQSVRVFAELSVTPADHLELDLYFDLISGGVESGEITGVLRYSGPTAVVFDADGNVVGFELDSFNDSSFKLTRAEPDPSAAVDNWTGNRPSRLHEFMVSNRELVAGIR